MAHHPIPYWSEASIQTEFQRRLTAATWRWVGLLVGFIVAAVILHHYGVPDNSLAWGFVVMKIAMMVSYASLRCPSCDSSLYKVRRNRCPRCGVQLWH